MVKILSQGGRSLADMYDVEGSIAGIDHLMSHELTLVHEMGATLFSERFRTTIRRATVSVAQSTAITLDITNLPESITRLLGVQVIADDATRVGNCVVSLSESDDLQDFPVWVYSGNDEVVRVIDDGSLGTFELLIPNAGGLFLPSFAGGSNQPGDDHIEDIHLRGISTGFGAGTVIVTLLVYLGFTYSGGVSGYGARVPSW